MVVDTSALVAILEGEPEGKVVGRLLEEAPARVLSAVSLLETSIVVGSRKGTAGTAALHSLLRDAALEVVAFDQQQADATARAYLRSRALGHRHEETATLTHHHEHGRTIAARGERTTQRVDILHRRTVRPRDDVAFLQARLRCRAVRIDARHDQPGGRPRQSEP